MDSVLFLIKTQLKNIFFGAWLLRRSSTYRIEQLHRDNTELLAGFGILTISLILLYMPVLYGKQLALPVMAFGAFRLLQGIKLFKYQRDLKQLKLYTVSLADMKSRPNELVFGRGFDWTPTYTQRFNQLLEQDKYKYTQPLASEKIVRFIDSELDESRIKAILKIFFPKLVDIEGLSHIHGVGMLEGEKNIVLPISERAGHVFICGATRVGKSVLLAYLACQDILRGNPVIILDPKGDDYVLRTCYAVARLAGREDVFNVIHLGRKELSAKMNPLYGYQDPSEVATQITDLLPTGGDGQAFKNFCWGHLNAISQALHQMGETISIRSLKPYTANVDDLVTRYFPFFLDNHYQPPNEMWSDNWRESSGDISSEKYRSEVRKHGNISGHYANPMNDEPVEKFSYSDIEIDLINEPDNLTREESGRSNNVVAMLRFMRAYMAQVKPLPIHDPVSALLETTKFERAYFQKLVAGLSPIMEQLASGDIGDILSPDFGELDENGMPVKIVTWEGVLKNEEIVYFALDALSNNIRATAVANMALASLTSTAGRIYKFGLNRGVDGVEKYKLDNAACIHADEVNELMGDQYIPLLNKAGGVGFWTCNYTQTVSDLVVRLGDMAKSGQAVGNMNTLIQLRVKEEATTQLLTKNAPKHNVDRVTWISGGSSSTDGNLAFGDTNIQRIETKPVESLTHYMIESQPKGQAFVRMRGGKVSHFRIPMLDTSGIKDMPKNIVELTDHMAKVKNRFSEAVGDPNYKEWLDEYKNSMLPVFSASENRKLKDDFVASDDSYWGGSMMSADAEGSNYGFNNAPIEDESVIF